MAAAKKKVTDEAGDAPEVVDTEAVETPDVDGADTLTEDDGPDTQELEPVDRPNVDDVVLRAQGLLGVRVTGVLDHGTKMALRQRQRALGLPASGRLDSRTRARLGLH